jgi:hypothetical protein
VVALLAVSSESGNEVDSLAPAPTQEGRGMRGSSTQHELRCGGHKEQGAVLGRSYRVGSVGRGPP